MPKLLPSSSRRIEQTLRELRSPGTRWRSKRVREYVLLATYEERQKDSSLSYQQARERAFDRLSALAQRATARDIVRALEKTAPTSRTPKREHIDDYAEIAAVLRLPVLRWLQTWMLERTNLRGPSPNRELVLAVFLHMAFAQHRPDVINTWKGFQRGQPLRNWAFDYPATGPQRSTLYESMSNMLLGRPSSVLLHTNLDLVRQLAAQRNPDGSLKHPDAGRVGTIDATLIEADLPQKSYRGEAHRLFLTGPDRRKASFVRYTHKGNTTRRCFGYKLLILSDMATTLPLYWRLIPAGGDERKETLALLRDYFQMVPDSRMWALVGDALYDQEKAFAHQLVFKWGLHPVFPKAGSYASDLPWVKTDGVPQCAHGDMKLKDWDGFLDADARLARGIPRGQEVRPNARLRWVCPMWRPGRSSSCCKGVETKPHTDPRLYTFLPRGGTHQHAALRTALLLRRNAIESINASLKHLGVGGKDQQRPRWAGDVEMDWLLSASLTFLTARRLAHETGEYELAKQEAQALGLWEQPSHGNPAPGPARELWAATREAREARWADDGYLPRQPSTWNDDRWREPTSGEDEEHELSALSWDELAKIAANDTTPAEDIEDADVGYADAA